MSETLRLEIPQSSETAVRVERRSGLGLRIAYARSADSQAAGEVGQDFIAVSGDHDWLAVVVSDGVSQSFFGDFASRYLGRTVLGWLQTLPQPPAEVDARVLRSDLVGTLQRATVDASARVGELPLPDDLPPMVQDVLEEKRALGSQANVAAGRIDLPRDTASAGHMVLTWLGDARIRLWETDSSGIEHEVDLVHPFLTEDRWSTRDGVIGDGPHIMIQPIRIGTKYRLQAYSDGLSELDRAHEPLSSADLSALMDSSFDAPTSDDIAIVEVWLPDLPLGLDVRSLSAPDWVELRSTDGELVAKWAEVQGARSYDVELHGAETQVWSILETSWRSPSLSPGSYALRIRAHATDGPGVWSHRQFVKVNLDDRTQFAGGMSPDRLSTAPLTEPATVHVASDPDMIADSYASGSSRPLSRAPSRGRVIMGAAILAALGGTLAIWAVLGAPSQPRQSRTEQRGGRPGEESHGDKRGIGVSGGDASSRSPTPPSGTPSSTATDTPTDSPVPTNVPSATVTSLPPPSAALPSTTVGTTVPMIASLLYRGYPPRLMRMLRTVQRHDHAWLMPAWTSPANLELAEESDAGALPSGGLALDSTKNRLARHPDGLYDADATPVRRRLVAMASIRSLRVRSRFGDSS